MRIETVTCVYNEEVILPFYLKHYSWVDRMNILYDEASTDRTLEILESAVGVRILPFSMPGGLDSQQLSNVMSMTYQDLVGCDFVILSDSDEFLLADRATIEGLAHPDGNKRVFRVRGATIYRHHSESDLDIGVSVKDQRRHGIFEGGLWDKPMIANGGICGLQWQPGNHECSQPPIDTDLVYAHWQKADPKFCVERMIRNRRDRMSQVNKDTGRAVHCQNITEKDVINECLRHEHDALLW